MLRVCRVTGNLLEAQAGLRSVRTEAVLSWVTGIFPEHLAAPSLLGFPAKGECGPRGVSPAFVLPTAAPSPPPPVLGPTLNCREMKIGFFALPLGRTAFLMKALSLKSQEEPSPRGLFSFFGKLLCLPCDTGHVGLSISQALPLCLLCWLFGDAGRGMCLVFLE